MRLHAETLKAKGPPLKRVADLLLWNLVVGALTGAGLTSTDVWIQLNLADTHGLRGNLNTLVFASELEALFERKLARRG